jgi:hypothetical protein
MTSLRRRPTGADLEGGAADERSAIYLSGYLDWFEIAYDARAGRRPRLPCR